MGVTAEHYRLLVIEDEVEIQQDGRPRWLTAELPRKLEDVEAWVARARK